MHIQSAHRDMTSSSGNCAGPNIPAIGDAARRVFNSLETLRIAAQSRGDISAQMAADALLSIAKAELKGLR